MKKIVILLVGVVIAASPLLKGKAQAASMTIGPYGYYAWWNPFFKKWIEGKGDQFIFPNDTLSFNRKFEMKQAPLYGGVFGIAFSEKWSFMNVFIMGKYITKSSHFEQAITVLYSSPYFLRRNQNTFKYDLDSTLNYNIKSFFKFFIGFKYQHYNFKQNRSINQLTIQTSFYPTYIIYEGKIEYHGLGGGLGFGFNVNLVENLYLLWNISILYQKPLMRGRKWKFMYSNGSIMPLNTIATIDLDYNSLGGNSTLSFAYYIPAASITITLEVGTNTYILSVKTVPDTDSIKCLIISMV